MARATLAHIIKDLRRKIYDYLPDTFDASVYMVGDTIRLGKQFRDLASVAATLSGGGVAKIYSPGEVVKVTAGSMVASTATGFWYYDFSSTDAMTQGIWRAEFTGSVGSTRRRGFRQFELRNSQYLWTDDELQTALDLHRFFVGGELREELKNAPDRLRFWSGFNNFDAVTFYTSQDQNSGTVTGATENLIAGEFVFTTAQAPPLYLEGHSYNIYAAAAEIMEALAADPNRAAIWSRGSVSQQGTQPLELATYYRRLAHGGRVVQLSRIYP